MVIRIISDLLRAYLVILFVRILASWFPIDPWSPLQRVVTILARLTDPVLVPLRRIIPPLRVGGTAVDLSPFAVFLALTIVLSVLSGR